MRLMSFWVCFLLWFFVISVFAYKEFNYNSAKNIAIDYIQNSSFDENWNWKNPTISGEWKYFYTDSNNPSYIEFKVSCDNEPNCWFIMVNFDGNDVSIPVSSTSWNTPSEVLEFKNGNKNNNFYYFSPFEQYAENEITWSVSSINPQDDEVLTNKTARSINIDNKSYKNNSLKEKLDNAKKESKKFKNSQEFKKLKKELKENKLTVPNEEISFKVLDMAMAEKYIPNQKWYEPVVASDAFVKWKNLWWCWSRIPCYWQYLRNYNEANWVNCYVWCTPIAVAMIYGYYDNNWFPNLIPTDTNFTNNLETIILADKIKNIIKTKCNSNWEWSTIPSNIPLAIQYAKDKGYIKSTSNYISWNSASLFPLLKNEINNWRPVILNVQWIRQWKDIWHSIVAYWYNSKSTNIIRVNMWWWEKATLKWINQNIYNYSNIDYNINAIYFWINTSPSSMITFNILK